MDDQHAGRACETCRMRRVKCDKRLPGCARCEKLGQPCSGYKTERRFFDDGAKVRRKFGDAFETKEQGHSPHAGRIESPHQSPTSLAAPRPIVGPAPGSFFNTILSDNKKHGRSPEPQNIWRSAYSPKPHYQHSGPLDQKHSARQSLYPSKQIQPLTIPEIDPYANPPTAQLLGNFNSYDVASNAVAPAPDEDFFDLDIDSYYANGNNACGFIPGLPVILSDINDIDPNETNTIGDVDSVTGSLPAVSTTRARSTRRRVGRAEADDRGQETAMLLHHFVEIMAPWMDIFDIDGYFSRIMPLKATDNVMLRSALAAVAAKRIAYVGGTPDKDLMSGHMVSNRSTSDQYPSDWFYKAASYYDKAISHLRIHLHRLAQAPVDQQPRPLDGETLRDTPDRRISSTNEEGSRVVKRRRTPPTHTRDAEIDDLLSAISVFSLYESLDNASTGFSQHLNGMQSLLEDKFRGRRMSGSLVMQPSARTDKAATAAFWNFAREDLLTAYANRQIARLDPTDIALWNAAGLPITHDDFALSSTIPLLDRLAEEGSQTGREEVFIAVLIWILMRVVNFVISDPTAPSTVSENFGTPRSAGSPGSTESTSPHAQQWQNLRGLLDGWYESLPITFDPYAELDYENEDGEIHDGVKKLFYSLPLAAAALSLYHFGQVLLILNQPLEVTQNRTPASRLRFLRAMTEESQSHARQICGIALGGPSAAVQRQLVQPLHLGGLCFEEDKDRRLVIDLLQGIGLEANCLTQSLIQDLYGEWGWVQAKP